MSNQPKKLCVVERAWVEYRCAAAALATANTFVALAVQSGGDAALRARLSAYRDTYEAAHDKARDAYDAAVDELSLAPE